MFIEKAILILNNDLNNPAKQVIVGLEEIWQL